MSTDATAKRWTTPDDIRDYHRETAPGSETVTYARRTGDAWQGVRIETSRAGRYTYTTAPYTDPRAAADAAWRSDGLTLTRSETLEELRRRMIEASNYTPAAADYELRHVSSYREEG